MIGRAGGTGTITVDGAGSAWTNSSAPAYFGYADGAEAGGTGSLTITNGGVVSLTGTPYAELFITTAVTLGYGAGSTGTVSVQGAGSTLDLTPGLNIGSAGGTGVLTIGNGGKVDTHDYLGVSGNVVLAWTAGSVGTINIGSASSGPAAAAGNLNTAYLSSGAGTGTVQFNTTASALSPYYFTRDGLVAGAAIAVTGTTQVVNTAGYNIIPGANYTGNTSLTGGTLVVNGTIGGTVVVNSGATFGGVATIGGLATVQGGSSLAPGNTIGVLNFAGGLTLLDGASVYFELGHAVSDQIRISGGVFTSSSVGGVTLNLANAGDFTTGNYTLFDFGSGGTITSGLELSDFRFGSVISGYDYSLALSGSALALTVTAVPEPATCATWAGLLALLGAAFKRRSKRG